MTNNVTAPVTPPAPRPAAAPAGHRHESVSYTGQTKLIFLWPLVAFGYLFRYMPGNPEVIGWIFIATLIICLLAVCVDLTRNHAVFWMVVVLLIVVFGFWLRDAKGITLFGDIYRWFASMDVVYNKGMGLALSIVLSIFFLIGLGWSYANNRYTMTHNEVVHHVWGRGDTSIGRGSRVITVVYPDWFEFMLCLAGTIIIHDNTGRTVIARTEHVPFLLLKAGKIDRLLESIEVHGDDQAGAAADHAAASNADDWH